MYNWHELLQFLIWASDIIALAFAPLSVIALIITMTPEYDLDGHWWFNVASSSVLIGFWFVNNTIYHYFPLWVYAITDSCFAILYIGLFWMRKSLFSFILALLIVPDVPLDILNILKIMSYPVMQTIESLLLLFMLITCYCVKPLIWLDPIVKEKMSCFQFVYKINIDSIVNHIHNLFQTELHEEIGRA